MNRLIISILLSFTILASIGGVNKAVLMSYTMLTDSEKAARLCTCTSCSSHTEDRSEELVSCCSSSSTSAETDTSSESDSETVMSCGIPTPDGSLVCGCDDNKLPEGRNMMMVIEKVTLPSFFTLIPPIPEFKSIALFQEMPFSLFHMGIFHPPRI